MQSCTEKQCSSIKVSFLHLSLKTGNMATWKRLITTLNVRMLQQIAFWYYCNSPPACEKSSLDGDRTCNESNTENDKLDNYYNLLEIRGKGGHAF